MQENDESLVEETKDPFINFLNKVVVLCVKVLAILMVLVILWSLFDVMMHLYLVIGESITRSFDSDQVVVVLGSFLAVLIAIEIFLNIIFYLKKDAVHVPLVLATALTAIARKVIILDYKALSPDYIFATAAVVFAVGVTFWLVTKKG